MSAVLVYIFSLFALGFSRNSDKCQVRELQKKVSLKESAICVVDINCRLLGCDLDIDQEENLLKTNEESFLVYLEANDALTEPGSFALIIPFNIGKQLGFGTTNKDAPFEAHLNDTSSIQGYARIVDLEIDG